MRLRLPIIDRYIIRKFLGTFFYAILIFGVVIPVIFDLTEKVDDVFEKDIPARELVFDYYVNFIPYFANLFTPLFLFISIVFFTSRMANKMEIVAILSSGVSFLRLLRPYLLSALTVALLALLLNSFIIPPANARRLKFEYKYLKYNWNRNYSNLHRQISPGRFIYLETFVSQTNSGNRFTIEEIEGQKMQYKASADYVQWDSTTGKWRLENFVLRRFGKNNTESVRRVALLDTVFNFHPGEFALADDDVEMMNMFELNRFIENEQMKGSDFIDYYVYEKYRRFANAFACIVLTFIAVPLAGRKVRGGIGAHIGIAIGIAFTYVLMMQISSVFATEGGVNPALSAWMPNILYSLLAVYLLIKAPK